MLTEILPPLEKLESFQDLAVKFEVRIGEQVLSLEEMAALDGGSLIRLDRAAGENLDVLINNVRLGSGEVVVMDDRVAIRMTEFAL